MKIAIDINNLRHRELTREAFEAEQRAFVDCEFFDLLTDERGECEVFVELALASYDELGSGRIVPLRPTPDSAFGPYAAHGTLPKLSSSLQARWQAWRADYQGLEARNPRLRLANMMHMIGESHVHISWPSGMEHQIWLWAREGSVDDRPFDDRHGIATQAFLEELRDLAQRLGGWLIYDGEHNKRLKFLTDGEFADRVRAETDARARKLREDEARSRAFREFVDAARADAKFWSALLAREHQLAIAYDGDPIRPPRAPASKNPFDFSLARLPKAAKRPRQTDELIRGFLDKLPPNPDLDEDFAVTMLRDIAARELGIRESRTIASQKEESEK